MIPVYFHQKQLAHTPVYEWAFGEKLDHPETSHRAENIFAALSKENSRFALREPGELPLELLKQVHNRALITLYQTAQKILPEGKTLYPSVFPKRGFTRADPKQLDQAGYYCFDSGTPLARTTWEAAFWSAACAHEAAQQIRSGKEKMVYALSRPPGHHASRDLFGGYCYFNNAAIVTQVLRERGRIAILDIDFHHGNGTQEIFYKDPDVLFLSVHGDPREFYPYFSGFAEETGSGAGKGSTINVPLPKGTDGQEYVRVLESSVLTSIRDFAPAALVVSAGFDTYKNDPIGRFTLETADFHRMGEAIGRLGLPTVVVQEGGYWVQELGLNVSTFLTGVRDGLRSVAV